MIFYRQSRRCIQPERWPSETPHVCRMRAGNHGYKDARQRSLNKEVGWPIGTKIHNTEKEEAIMMEEKSSSRRKKAREEKIEILGTWYRNVLRPVECRNEGNLIRPCPYMHRMRETRKKDPIKTLKRYIEDMGLHQSLRNHRRLSKIMKRCWGQEAEVQKTAIGEERMLACTSREKRASVGLKKVPAKGYP